LLAKGFADALWLGCSAEDEDPPLLPSFPIVENENGLAAPPLDLAELAPVEPLPGLTRLGAAVGAADDDGSLNGFAVSAPPALAHALVPDAGEGANGFAAAGGFTKGFVWMERGGGGGGR
jgi:hypothetical protein